MKDKFDFKTLSIIELVLLVMIGFFSFDFLPRTYNEFQGICAQTWPKDPKQYQICMQPYFRDTATDKYAIGAVVGGLIIAPLIYFFKRKQN